MMDIEKMIRDLQNRGYTRLDAIASLNLGERSKAAARASSNRARRKELVELGVSFKTACAVVQAERLNNE